MKQQLPQLGIWLGRAASVVLCLIMAGTLIAPAAVHLSGQAISTMFLDNRAPKPFPGIPTTIHEVDKYRDNISAYMDDSFGLRAEIVVMNYRLHALLGVSSNPGLVIGKQGWAFLKTDHDVFNQFRGLNRFSDQELDAWIDDMETYRRWLEMQGAAFMIVVAPNQQTAYPEFMPTYANRVWPETRLDQVVRRLRERQSKVAVLDLRPDIFAARKFGLPLYHKYENHWTWFGAFIGYTAVMRSVTSLFPDVKPMQLSDYDVLTNNTATWRIPPQTESDPALRLKGPTHVTGTEVLGYTNTQPVRKTTSDRSEAPDMMIYGDSFAEQGLLAPFNETFRSVTYAQANHGPLPYDLVKTQKPKLVIFEMVERYLARQVNLNPQFKADLAAQESAKPQ